MLTERRLTTVLIVFLAAPIFVWGCADPTPSTGSETAVQEAPIKESAKEQDSEKVEEEGAETQLEEVDWEEAKSYAELAVDRLSEQAQGVVGDSPVPVILPDDDQLLASAHITVGDAWYEASMQGERHSVAINGTHRSHSAPGVGGKKEDDHSQPQEHLLTRTHGIVTLAFEEFGVAYAIDVECENPLENPLCAKDEYVLSIAENAGVVGGTK